MELLDLFICNEDSVEPRLPRHFHHRHAHGVLKLELYRPTQAVALPINALFSEISYGHSPSCTTPRLFYDITTTLV